MADINDWKRGNGTDALKGNTNVSLIDDNVTDYIQDPIEVMLSNYRRGCLVAYASSSSVTVAAGEVMCKNSGGDIKRMRANTASIPLDVTTELDTGSVAPNTQYYVYAVADATDTTFTGIISASDVFPTGITYAKKLGQFYYTTVVTAVEDDDVTTTPPGVVMDFAGAITSVPSGWLYCDGSAVSRTTYASLFTAIGSIWGAGDGSTTFNIPDTVNRFRYGASDGSDAGNASPGSVGIGSRGLAGNDDDVTQLSGSGQKADGGGTGTPANSDLMSPYAAFPAIIKI